MDIELLVILDPADSILVHSNPLSVAIPALLNLIPLLIMRLVPKVVLVKVFALLDINPVLLVLGELLVANLAPPLKLVHVLLDLVVELGTLLENVLQGRMLLDCVRLIAVLGLETDPELAVHLLLFELGCRDALASVRVGLDFRGFRPSHGLLIVNYLRLLDLDWVIAMFVTIKF